MLPYLRVGPFLLQLSGLALLLGFWLGLSVSEREAKRRNANPNEIYNLAFFAALTGLVGARIGYAARYPSPYLQNPISLLALNANTLSPMVGILTGVLMALFYGKRRELPLRSTLDILAPGLAVMQIFLGVAHLLSGEDYGMPAQLPWAIYLWTEYRHPTQIYEITAAVITLGILVRRSYAPGRPGAQFLILVALSAGLRLFLEAFRGDSLLWMGGLRSAQVISLFVLLGALWLMEKWTKPLGVSEALPSKRGIV